MLICAHGTLPPAVMAFVRLRSSPLSPWNCPVSYTVSFEASHHGDLDITLAYPVVTLCLAGVPSVPLHLCPDTDGDMLFLLLLSVLQIEGSGHQYPFWHPDEV